MKKVFLKISQNSHENTCIEVFFNKNAALRIATLLKQRIQHCRFPMNFAKFLKTTFYRTLPGDCFFNLINMQQMLLNAKKH